MKHAGSESLQNVSELLQQIRLKEGIRERKIFIFTKTLKAFSLI